jgi:hypothetical protein
MRTFLTVGAIALAAGLATPASAGSIPCLGTSLTSPLQEQCAANVVYKGKYNKQWDIKQTQGGKVEDGSHDVQRQFGLNLIIKGKGNEQYIEQNQYIKSKDAEVHGHPKYAPYLTTPTQDQLAVNVVYKGSHNGQSITQSQSLYNWSDEKVYGTQQSQGALNVVVMGSGNTQNITQSQTMTIVD